MLASCGYFQLLLIKRYVWIWTYIGHDINEIDKDENRLVMSIDKDKYNIMLSYIQ
jgi:hypothetical protein